MATVARKMMGGSVRRIGNDVLASPRAFSIGAPIEDHARTAMIGAAEDFPYAPGTFASPAGVRITIAARVCLPRSLESSTPAKDAAKEGGEGPPTRLIAFGKGSHRRNRAGEDPNPVAPSALDTEVVLTKIQVVDDATDSGATKLGPGVFADPEAAIVPAPGKIRISN
jgi:hypothetical protein